MPKPNIPRFKKRPSGNRNLAKDVKTLVRAATYVPRKLLKAIGGKSKMQPPTPSGVKGAAAGATAPKPKAEAPKTKPQATGGNVTGGNRAGSPGSTKNPIAPKAPKAEKAPMAKEQRVAGRVKSSSPGGASSQQQKIKDEIASLKISIKNAKTGKQKGKLQKRLESLQAKLK
jgi:hypothetical protein